MSYQETKLQAIADAIREKDGTTEPIPANDFPARIRAIPAGGLPDNVRTITLTADPPEGGTVSGGGVAQEGMKVTVSANNGEGYSFSQWQENGAAVSNEAEYTFTVTGDKTLTAAFEEITSRLPNGYTELEYVNNPNLGYIILNTLNPVYTKTWFAEIKVEITVGAVSTECSFMGSYIRYSGYYWCSSLITRSGGTGNYDGYGILQGATGSSYKNFNAYVPISDSKVVITVDRPGTGMLNVNGTEKSISGAYTTPLSYLRDPVILGSYGKVGNTNPVGYNYTFYGLKAYDISGALISEIVPAMKDNGEIGLFDIVTNAFSSPPNAALVAGPAV